MALSGSNLDFERQKFVESPTRPNNAAVEVVGTMSLDEDSLNTKEKILKATDRVQSITYADFGNKNQRVTQIDYSASSVGIQVARKTFTYSLQGTRYRRDSISWSIV